MTVGLILVSHSRSVAEGTAELAAQMAPSVVIVAAGGTDDGGIGTSFELVGEAIQKADTGDGAVVLYDLGSALLTTETAVEFLDPDQAARITVVDAPLVEGAIAAAVTAEGGASLDEVVVAAQRAGAAFAPASENPGTADGGSDGVGLTATVSLRNPLGLHARPAAELVRALKGHDAEVRVGRPDGPSVDLRSVLGVVGLRLRGGDEVRLQASGSDAEEVLTEIERLVNGGFGELEVTGNAPESAAAAPAPAAAAAGVVDGTLLATPGAPGRAVGRIRHLGGLPAELPAGPGADPAAEGRRLDAAITAAGERLSGQGVFGAAHAALRRRSRPSPVRGRAAG